MKLHLLRPDQPKHTERERDRYVYVLCGSGIIITISSS